MRPLSEQFSEARKLQLDTQFNFFHNFTGKAFDSAEKLVALNLDTSRASLEQSSNLVRQLIAVKDPRDLFVLTSQTQSQFDSVLSYGRRLFGIAAGTATGAAPAPAVAAPAIAAPAPAVTALAPEALAATALAAATALVAEAAPAAEPAAVAAAAPAAAVVAAPLPEPTLVVEAKRAAEAAATVQPIAQPKPVASAVGLPEAITLSAASFPVPSSAEPIAVAPVKPLEATPPAAQASGTPAIATTKAAAPGPKATRKK